MIRFDDTEKDDEYTEEEFLQKKRGISDIHNIALQRRNQDDYDIDEASETDYRIEYQEEIELEEISIPKEEEHLLKVDVYETRDSLYILAFVGGTRKNDISISLSRTTILIQGERSMPYFNGADAEYHSSELAWGKFTREITLPEEVEIDMTEAKEDNGLLTVKLIKVDRQKTARIKVS